MTLIMVLLAALATAPDSGDVDVVRRLYTYVVQSHPLGIPSDAEMQTIGPLLSSHVTAILDAGRACEADYFRQYKATLSDGKPEFGWLERGLFSGENESAIPVEFRIVKSAPGPAGGRKVVVELTYRDTSETYCCWAPDPRNTYRWRVAVLVKTESGRFVIDDVVHDAERVDRSRWRLSTSFKGCAGKRWVGARSE
jgi:hypothetical protein